MGSLVLDFSDVSGTAPPAPEKTAPEKPVFDYMAAVTETYNTYPVLKDRLFFYDLGKGAWVHPDPQAHIALHQRLSQDPAENKLMQERMAHFAAEKNSCAMRGKNGDYFILLYTNDDKARMLGPNMPLAQDLQFVFDHELGHIIAPNGGRSPQSLTRHENVADTYAAMRHFQRFGLQSKGIAELLLTRAQRMVSLTGARNAEHFTGFVLEKLLAEKDKMRLERLDIKQTAELAGDFATRHTPGDGRVLDLSAAFNTFQRRLETQTEQKDVMRANSDGGLIKTDAAFRTLAETVMTTKSDDALHWGAKVLNAYINGLGREMRNGKIIVNSPPAVLEGPYWQHIKKTLEARVASAEITTPAGLILQQPPARDMVQDKTACPTKRALFTPPV